MLGEDHSLVHDFPEYLDVIADLTETNLKFATESKKYHSLDKEIRTLELRSSPIDDQAMHQLKHDRANLKDSLFEQLQAARN